MTKQEPVQVHTQNGKDYIQIYAHEQHAETENVMTGEAEETNTRHYFTYDFCEIIVPEGEIDIGEIMSDPEAYLDYKPEEKPTIEDLQEGLLALQEVMLGGDE